MNYNDWQTHNPNRTVSGYVMYCRENGERADLSEADLSVADLSGANLSVADLSGANLSMADLRPALIHISEPTRTY